MEQVKEVLLKIQASTKESERKYKCDYCFKEITGNEFIKSGSYNERIYCDYYCEYLHKEKTDIEYYCGIAKEIIPEKYLEIEFEDKIGIDKYKDKSVLLMGNVGVGKTTTMSVLARKYIMAGRRVEWISYPAFIMKLQSMFRKDNESPYDYASEIARFRGILMIDDLGAEKLSDFVRQVTYYIINEREQRMLKTIITTNFTLEQICDQIDPRISSRLVGMCEVVKLSGKDKRLSK